jgi:hypothetical protein
MSAAPAHDKATRDRHGLTDEDMPIVTSLVASRA